MPDQIPDDDEEHIVVGPVMKDVAEKDTEEAECLQKKVEHYMKKGQQSSKYLTCLVLLKLFNGHVSCRNCIAE
eukprot:4371562-Ditylum_brightwellii.AAC.1